MSAFFTTAEFSTATFGSEAIGVVVSIPLDALIYADTDFVVHSGASLLVPSDNLNMATVFRLSAGHRIVISPQNLSWVDEDALASGGASIFAPIDNVNIGDYGAAIHSGASLLIPRDEIDWIDKAIMHSSGVRLFIPKDNLTLDETYWVFSTSVLIRIPVDPFTWDDMNVRVSSGTMIRLDRLVNMNLAIESTGEHITAEYVTTDGNSETQPVHVPDRLVTTTMQVMFSSGASRFIPKDELEFTYKRFEVGARRRKLRTSVTVS